MSSDTHLVGRQRIRIRYGGAQESLAIRSAFSNLCKTELPQLLERVLDEMDDKDTVLRIQNLNLELRIDEAGLSLENLEKEILKTVEKSLREKLLQSKKVRASIAEDLLSTWRHYLLNGYLPQWSLYKSQIALHEALKSILKSPETSLDLSGILEALGDKHARIRFEKMMPYEMLPTFSSLSKIMTLADWKLWEQFIQVAGQYFGRTEVLESAFRAALIRFAGTTHASKTEEDQNQYFTQIFQETLQENGIGISENALAEIPTEEERNVIHRIFPKPKLGIAKLSTSARKQVKGEEIQTKESTATREQDLVHREGKIEVENQKEILPSNEELETRINLKNGGLIILVPFLSQLFSNLNLDIAVRTTDIPKAATVLHFLVFGEEHFSEDEVVLEKIILGLPLSKGIENIEPLSELDKEQCEALLQSVIVHWSILKNTSIEGLRNSFLKREGLLTNRNGMWTLHIQRESIDILIDRLPWSISIIKTPWMKRYLTITW